MPSRTATCAWVSPRWRRSDAKLAGRVPTCARLAQIDPGAPQRRRAIHGISVDQAHHGAGEFAHRVTLDGAGQWQPRLQIAALQQVDECHTRQITRRGV